MDQSIPPFHFPETGSGTYEFWKIEESQGQLQAQGQMRCPSYVALRTPLTLLTKSVTYFLFEVGRRRDQRYHVRAEWARA